MAGRVEGKVAFITGAARGQDRNSLRSGWRREGADIIAVDDGVADQQQRGTFQLPLQTIWPGPPIWSGASATGSSPPRSTSATTTR